MEMSSRLTRSPLLDHIMRKNEENAVRKVISLIVGGSMTDKSREIQKKRWMGNVTNDKMAIRSNVTIEVSK